MVKRGERWCNQNSGCHSGTLNELSRYLSSRSVVDFHLFYPLLLLSVVFRETLRVYSPIWAYMSHACSKNPSIREVLFYRENISTNCLHFSLVRKMKSWDTQWIIWPSIVAGGRVIHMLWPTHAKEETSFDHYVYHCVIELIEMQEIALKHSEERNEGHTEQWVLYPINGAVLCKCVNLQSVYVRECDQWQLNC